ncbi:MAG: hypothetical protein C0597_13035, partial [Marinilabiliales bacterium]
MKIEILLKITRKLGILALLLILSSCHSNGQIKSGIYDNGLKLAYNPSTNSLTGIFENYSGYDENTGNHRFSCIFYIQGFLLNNASEIETFYPLDKSETLIAGELNRLEDSIISIKLNEEHGGCWNVWNFADDFSKFSLEESKNWLEIKYVVIEKAFFYHEKIESTKRKAYVLKGDLVFIDKIESDWIHCNFYGKTVTQGWLRRSSV